MGGAIKVEVIGKRRRSDLPCGGLDIPCIMTLEHKDGMIKKARELLKKKGFPEATSKSKSRKRRNTISDQAKHNSPKRLARPHCHAYSPSDIG